MYGVVSHDLLNTGYFKYGAHVIRQSDFVSEGHGVLTEMEHGIVIIVVWCETCCDHECSVGDSDDCT